MRGIAGILVLVSKTRTRLGSLRGSLGSSCLTITTRGASFDITNIEMTLRLVCRDWADLPLYGLFFCFPRVFGLPTFLMQCILHGGLYLRCSPEQCCTCIYIGHTERLHALQCLWGYVECPRRSYLSWKCVLSCPTYRLQSLG